MSATKVQGSPLAERVAGPAIEPSLDTVQSILSEGTYTRVPVKREIYADSLTPVEAMRRLRAASDHCFMLESAEADESWGRYTFLGFNPSLELTCNQGHLHIRRVESLPDGKSAVETVEERLVDHPGDEIRSILAAHESAQPEGFPPFTGGLVGYFSYDYITYGEPRLRAPLRSKDDVEGIGADFLDVDLMLFDTLIAFDAYRQKIILMAGVYGPEDPNAPVAEVALSYEAAARRIDEMERILRHGDRFDFEPLQMLEPLDPTFSKERYCSMVEKARHYIHEGDIFQVVLSNPRRAKATGSLFDTYRVLRCENPSPYMFYFSSDAAEIAGASPETLVRLRDGELATYPLAGTRPRGATPDEDEALEAELRADEKELSEHNMLVDLGRNDLGRIAAVGSVNVDTYAEVLRFSRVMHLGSSVSAQIAEHKDAVDAVDAILPAGTLSGAPKIRACEIIQELEGGRRGVYGGAIGYLDFSGNLDLCISIRLAYKMGDMVCVQSGAGIVADSVPESENQECLNKARAVIEALQAAEGGIA